MKLVYIKGYLRSASVEFSTLLSMTNMFSTYSYFYRTYRILVRIIKNSLLDKSTVYTNQILEVLKTMKTSHKNLESIIGRLEWTSYVVPNAKFILNRIRHLLHYSDKHG